MKGVERDSCSGGLEVRSDFGASDFDNHMFYLMTDDLSDHPFAPSSTNFHFSAYVEELASSFADLAAGAESSYVADVSAAYHRSVSGNDSAEGFSREEVPLLSQAEPVATLCSVVSEWWDDDVDGIVFW